MCRVVFQPVLLSEQAGDDLSQGVAYAGGDGAYAQDFEALELGRWTNYPTAYSPW
jgi:hypothetical protein